MNTIEDVVRKSQEYWNTNSYGDTDPNPWDYLHLAATFENESPIHHSSPLMPESELDEMLTLYEEIVAEKNAPEGYRELLIRTRTADKLSTQLKQFVAIVKKLNLVFGSDEEIAMNGTFLYYGFFRLAKHCRDKDKDGNEIDDNSRFIAYEDLAKHAISWPWVRAGIILVRKRKIERGGCDKWIPKGSVYWEEI